MKRSRLISLIIVVVSVAAAAFAVVSVAGGPGGGPPGGPQRPQAQTPAPASTRQFAVRTVTVEPGVLEAKTKLNGEVVPESSVEVLPDVAGTVSQIPVDVGDVVSAGAVVAYVDPSRPGTRFQASPVTAPIAGTITAVYLDPGATVAATSPIVQIGTLDSLEIVVDVPERFVGALKPGNQAEVIFSAFPDQPRQAVVSRISPVLDPQARSKEAAFVLDPPWPSVQAGMFAEVTFVTRRKEGVLAVPSESVVTRGAEDSVFVVDDGKAALVSVRTGMIAGGMIEILEGLRPGQEVVSEGQSLLENGSAVRIVNTMENAS